MAPSMKYWDDWVDPTDMRAMWSYPEVYNEWTAAGETEGHKVHMSRNPDGQPYVTQTEMKAMAVIINNRHFNGMLDSEMICAIAEIESDRQPLAYRYEPKLGEASTGLMQTLQSTAEWLAKDMGYRAYTVDWTTSMLYKPFVSIYFGAAYLRWLSTYDGKLRNEEFMVRAYSGGPKKAAKRSTQEYWNKYLIAKQCISFLVPAKGITATACSLPGEMDKNGQIFSSGKKWWYWEDKVHEEDMIEMRKRLDVKKEWIKAGEKDGKIRFARDSKLRPYLTRAELKAVAEITISRHFKEKNVNLVMLCALAEVCSGRLVHGRDPPGGVMGIPFKIAEWLYSECGCKFYKVKSLEDLSRPFISMYFAACYVCWLSSYEGRQRSEQFIVQAYCSGPHAINTQEARLFWLKYLDAVSVYQAKQRNQHGSCSIQ